MTDEAPKQSFQERFKSKPENAAKAAAEIAARTRPRVTRSQHLYAKLHIVHLVQLAKIDDPVAFMLFALLLGESFLKRGKPFELPINALTQLRGLRRRGRLRVTLHKLEQAGLISIADQGAPQPPLIQVPLAL